MPFVKRNVSVMDSPTAPVFGDRMIVGQQLNVANVIGGGAGAAVTTTVTWPKELPSAYQVLIGVKQDCTWYVTNRTVFGFDVVLTPRLAANTLAAGNFDVLVVSA